MSSPPWEPLLADGSAAAAGSSGRWLTEGSDLVGTDAEARVALWSADRLPLAFPRDWPAVFKNNATLKAMLNKKMLCGVRCRAVDPPSEADEAAASAAGVPLRPLHSFDNAEAVAAKLGWQVIKGFVVLERTDRAAGESFVALRHWWNARSEGGAWVDLTPCVWSADGRARVVLVESLLGEKQPTLLTAASRDFAMTLAARLGAGARPAPPLATADVPASDGGSGGEGGGGSGGGGKVKPGRLDYAKWDHLDVSDDDEPAPPPVDAAEAARAAEHHRKVAEEQQRRAEQQAVRSVVDAAAAATAAGDADALAKLQEQARAAAPLDEPMEQILAALPEAAQLAARAAAAAAASSSAGAGAGAGAAGAADADGGPSLRELMAAAKLGVGDDDADGDPQLEDPGDFVDDVATAARIEAEREAAALARARAVAQRPAEPTTPGSAEARFEWLGEWTDYGSKK